MIHNLYIALYAHYPKSNHLLLSCICPPLPLTTRYPNPGRMRRSQACVDEVVRGVQRYGEREVVQKTLQWDWKI